MILLEKLFLDPHPLLRSISSFDDRQCGVVVGEFLQTSYGRIQYHKPSWIVEKDGRVVQTDGYGNKRYDRPQYKVEGDKVYETDGYGRKQQRFEIENKDSRSK